MRFTGRKPRFNLFKKLNCSVILPVLAAGILTACSHAQLFGSSPQRDIEQGKEVAKLVERQIGLYSPPVTEAYVREVGQRLVVAADDPRWKFSFQIVDQEEPNAFAIPGGGIYVSRGLLALLEREDELAGVLAHEIAHVTRRHSARQERKGFLPGLLTLPGNVVGSVVSENLGALINAPIETVGGAWLSHYSRSQETEADRIGIRTATLAGYQPTALADILERLDRDAASQTGKERRFSIFDSHPMTATRLKDIQRGAASLSPAAKAPVVADTAALFAKLDGIWWGENPEDGVFHKDQFLQPVIGFTITLPAGWKHRNTPQYVISMETNKEAMLLLGLAGPAADPESTGQGFIKQMRTKAGIEPVSTRKTDLGGFPAFLATYQDRSGRTPVYLHFLWVTMAERTYQLIGVAPDQHRETLRNAALTLRPLTEAERSSVTGKRLRIVAARRGERLEDLSARSGNTWSPAYTALANGLDVEATLSEEQLVKIARLEPVARTISKKIATAD
jgi:predicted Zn-dependent protease